MVETRIKKIIDAKINGIGGGGQPSPRTEMEIYKEDLLTWGGADTVKNESDDFVLLGIRDNGASFVAVSPSAMNVTGTTVSSGSIIYSGVTYYYSYKNGSNGDVTNPNAKSIQYSGSSIANAAVRVLDYYFGRIDS